MQIFIIFLQNTHIKIIFNMLIFIGWLTIAGLFVFFVLHTAYVLGGMAKLYKKTPIEGWNKRFYPAFAGVVMLILLVIWLLGLV